MFTSVSGHIPVIDRSPFPFQIQPVFHAGTPFQHNYYQEGLEKGYFVRRGKSKEVWRGYSNSVLLDISNPQAYQWMLDIIVKVWTLGGDKGKGVDTGWG